MVLDFKLSHYRQVKSCSPVALNPSGRHHGSQVLEPVMPVPENGISVSGELIWGKWQSLALVRLPVGVDDT
jgi:hypothetical protein